MSKEQLSAFESSESLFAFFSKPFEKWDDIMKFLSCNKTAQTVINSVRNILG